MTATLVVTTESEASRLLPWAWKFAQSSDLDLTIVVAQEREGGREWAEIELSDRDADATLYEAFVRLAGASCFGSEAGGDEGQLRDTSQVVVQRLRDPHPDRALLDRLPQLNTKLLMVRLGEPGRDLGKTWQGRLYRAASCETIFLRVPRTAHPNGERILVPTSGGVHAHAALQRANKMVGSEEGRVTALYVIPEVDVLSGEVAERILDKIVRRALGRDSVNVDRRVIVANQFFEGMRQALQEPYDLVLVGAVENRSIRNVLLGGGAIEIFAGPDAPAFGALRAALPIGTRSRQAVERFVRRWVPQLDREGRVSLVERVQDSSRWDFDFIALICLSTLIAALGLARNQAPVVIGAMLVAPLMTPLVGAGLAVVQGNSLLVWKALQSVLYGFLLAFIIGGVVGALGMYLPFLEMDGLSNEIIGRTAPGLVDLAVALVGGMAAAYAMSRPNLSSALPGVAIAAALVPPIASAGITCARGDWVFARSALLLFLTNIVAIVIGTTISLWLVGIRDTHQHGTKQKWVLKFGGCLLAVSVGLAFVISHRAPVTGHAAVDALKVQIRDAVESMSDQAVLVALRQTSQNELVIIMESTSDEVADLPERLRELANSHFAREDMRVKLEVRHVVSAGPPK